MILSTLLSESNTSHENYDVEATNHGYAASGAGAMQIVSESNVEMHNISKAMNAVDYQSITLLAESNVEEMQELQEAAMNGVFGKIKQAIMKMWSKIKEFFSNVQLHLSKVMKDDKFLNKYKAELQKASTLDFEYEGFDYKLDAINLDTISSTFQASFNSHVAGKAHVKLDDPSTVVSKLHSMGSESAKAAKTDVLEKRGELTKEVFDEVRKAVVGGDGEQGEYKTQVLNKLRGGEEKKKISVSVSDIMATIEGKDKSLAAIKKSSEAANKAFKQAVDWVGKAEKAVSGGAGKITADQEKGGSRDAFSVAAELLRFYAGLNQQALGLLSTTAGYQVDAAKGNIAQSRDIAQKLLIHNRKGGKKKLNESTAPEGTSLFDQIYNQM